MPVPGEEEGSVGRVARWVLVVLAAVLLVAVVAGGGLFAAVSAGGQTPQNGTYTVPGLADDATISRDVNGITQVSAATEHDLFFAQGWLHASERLWQMEIYRRIGAGRLAELFGESQVETDAFIRTLDWRGAAQRDYEGLSPEMHDILDAYSAGVNAYIDGHPGSLGPAFVVAGALSGAGSGLDGYRPEPWTPIDTLTFAKIQAWGLGGNMDTEIFRMLADAGLGDPALTDQLFPAYPSDRPLIAAEGVPGDGVNGGAGAPAGATSSGIAATGPVSDAEAQAWTRLGLLANRIPALAGLTPERDLVADGGVGSNNWVVAPQHTTTGSALLANDPHLGLDMPSIWYVNGLHCLPVSDACDFNVQGVSFPGTPGVILGHNEHVAWGVTNVNPDVQDLVMEKLDPADPTKYLTATGSEPFTVRTETIKVAGGDDVTLDIRSTRHGPVINDVNSKLKASDTLLALRWTALSQPDGVMEAFINVDRASNYQEFRDALRPYGAPSQNFVYADDQGNIGYQMPGLIPVRTESTDLGLRPVPGWDGKHEWESFIPFDSLPTVYNPPSGRIVSANNAPASGDLFIGYEFDMGDRATRITQMIDEAGDTVSLDTLAEIQGDTLLLRGQRMQTALASMRPVPTTADGKAVLDAITAWNGRCATDSTGCAAFSVFEYALERAIFDDELGANARDYVGSDWANELITSMVGTPEGRTSPWWHDARSGQAVSYADSTAVAATALDTAGSWLRRDLGNPDGWQWGRIHQISFNEATLGSSGIGPLEWYFGTPAAPVNGASGAVDNTYYRLSRGYADPYDPASEPVATLGELFDVTNGPSMRALYDMGALDTGRIITTTGQSGSPFNGHNSDWVNLWLANETVPFPFSPEAIAKATVNTVVLQPAR
jgi:penicillin G amidase